jgi:hypothetical protein
MSDPVPVKARIRDTLKRMYEWVDEVLAIYYDNYFITTDFEYDISKVPAFPTVVINNDSGPLTDPNYGRRTPNKGSLISNAFFLYIYDSFNDSPNEDDYRDAQIVTRRIIDYLNTKNQNQIEMSTHGIWGVTIQNIRRSETGVREVSRYVVTISVESVREDVP